MIYTIIGGSGFIGSKLCDRLQNNNKDFIIIDRTESSKFRSRHYFANVQDKNALYNLIPEKSCIINLAAEHKDNVLPKSLYYDVNVTGAKNICEIAEKKGINKIIFTSSVAVYGFAPVGTDESGEINFFNEYGKTKFEAELIFKKWQAKDPSKRCLVIIRPTVVFGEKNRGNVYNLFKQIASRKFLMIGDGKNIKSMAYVDNVAAFIEYTFDFNPGIHVYNYVDKPDLSMNELVLLVSRFLGIRNQIKYRIPFYVGNLIGKSFDLISQITKIEFKISSIRIKKFCSDSSFNTSLDKTGFIREFSIQEGIERTLRYEFGDEIEKDVFNSDNMFIRKDTISQN